MKLILVLASLISLNSFAQTKMSEDANEMFRLMRHPTILECLQDVGTSYINLEITKKEGNCSRCATYTMSYNELRIDIPSSQKTKIKIVSKPARGFGGAPVTTYTCTVSE